MFEYHGWVAVRASGASADDLAAECELAPEIDAAIGALIEPLAGYALMDWRWMNGARYLHMAGYPNHRGRRGNQIIELFMQVGALAPGSYGLLYVYDDEDDTGMDNEFQVFRMTRGQVSTHDDPFLSPFVPALEDPPPYACQPSE